jgi:hypothetical protein
MKSKKKDCGCGKMSVRKKMQHGGLHTDPTEPTRADSLDLYNNALLVKDYYMGRGTYKWDPIINIADYYSTQTDFNGMREKLENLRESLEEDYGDPDEILNFKNRALLELKRKYGSFRDIPIDESIDASIRAKDMYKSIDPYRFKSKEEYDIFVDENAPMHLFDTRISPTQLLEGKNIKKGDIMRGDSVGFYAYDPIAVAPWDELTLDQIIERVKKYGNSGVPVRYQDPNQPGYGVQSSQSSPTPYPSQGGGKLNRTITAKPPSRPRIEIDKMPPLDFSNDLTKTLQPIESPEVDRLIDTQGIYNARGNKRSLAQVGEKRLYERPDGTRYMSVDMFSPEMIRQLRRLQQERERGTVTL